MEEEENGRMERWSVEAIAEIQHRREKSRILKSWNPGRCFYHGGTENTIILPKNQTTG